MLEIVPDYLRALDPRLDRTRRMLEGLGLSEAQLGDAKLGATVLIGAPATARSAQRLLSQRLVDLLVRLEPLVGRVLLDAPDEAAWVEDSARALPGRDSARGEAGARRRVYLGRRGARVGRRGRGRRRLGDDFRRRLFGGRRRQSGGGAGGRRARRRGRLQDSLQGALAGHPDRAASRAHGRSLLLLGLHGDRDEPPTRAGAAGRAPCRLRRRGQRGYRGAGRARPRDLRIATDRGPGRSGPLQPQSRHLWARGRSRAVAQEGRLGAGVPAATNARARGQADRARLWPVQAPHAAARGSPLRTRAHGARHGRRPFRGPDGFCPAGLWTGPRGRTSTA